jgi:Domain of unknown function (DUF4260)
MAPQLRPIEALDGLLTAERRGGRAASPPADGVVTGAPKAILRLEGAAVLAAASAAYSQLEMSWMLFALLFLVPDVSMLGYLIGRQIGATLYNLGHSYVLPMAFGAVGVLLSQPLLAELSLVWVAHIGFDRMLGYGLKYPTAFGHTHLGVAGKLRGHV